MLLQTLPRKLVPFSASATCNHRSLWSETPEPGKNHPEVIGLLACDSHWRYIFDYLTSSVCTKKNLVRCIDVSEDFDSPLVSQHGVELKIMDTVITGWLDCLAAGLYGFLLVSLAFRYFEVELTEHSDPKYYRWHVAPDGRMLDIYCIQNHSKCYLYNYIYIWNIVYDYSTIIIISIILLYPYFSQCWVGVESWSFTILGISQEAICFIGFPWIVNHHWVYSCT